MSSTTDYDLFRVGCNTMLKNWSLANSWNGQENKEKKNIFLTKKIFKKTKEKSWQKYMKEIHIYIKN